MSTYLGLDIGTTAVKALLLDEQGQVRALASREYAYHTPHAGWVEQDAEDWWRLACECVREVTAAAPHPVRALAVSTQGDTVVPLDRQGRPLARAITWMDSRALPQVREMAPEADHWFELTGSTPAPYSAATSLMWWRDEQPALFAQAARFALVADFLVERLTGHPALDAPNASRTMLYDIRHRAWASSLLERVGVAPARLPETAESGTEVGTVRTEIAAQLGLPAGTRVILGGHDQTCAAIGCGVTRPGRLMLSCGTAWVVLAATHAPLYDEQRSLQTYCHAVPGGYACLGAFAGGNLLRWFRDHFWQEQTGNAAYEAITAAARAARETGRPSLLFLPHFYGASGPVACQQARGAWAGLTLAHPRDDLALGLLQGVALQTSWVVANLARQGAAVDDIRMIGGGARSRFWAQLVADAAQTPLQRPVVSEAAACGAALLAATACGAFSSLEDAVGAVPIQDTVFPERGNSPEELGRMARLMAALTPLWEQLAQLPPH